MKRLRRVGLGMALMLVSAFMVQAQGTVAPDSIVQLTAEARGLSLVSAADVPEAGTFWLVLTNGIAPDPAPLFDPGLPVYAITNGEFLVDATDGQVDTEGQPSVAAALAAQAAAVVDLINQVQAAPSQPAAQSQRAGGLHALDEGGGFSPALSLDTNGLFLQINGVTNGVASLNLFNGTDTVYAVWGSTNLATPVAEWQVMAELWPTNGTTNTLPFTVNAGDDANLFLQAQDWAGAETNGLPCWWLWAYFQSLNYTAGTLDSQGNTLGFDYTNNLDPNIIQFTLQFPSNCVSASIVYGTVTILGGTPSYEAILINDTNYSDAVWLPYTSTNVTVNLESGNEIYNVMVGLRGLPTNAAQTWLGAQLTLNTVAPVLTVTNPVTNTVSQPMIQLQGYVDESLSSLTFDVSNAVGGVTNQAGYWQAAFYDTNLLTFTTNSFQCYDIPLTNGLNTITLHATDVEGNTTTTNFSYTLSYAGVTNLPALTLVWPLAGTQIGGANFTLQAQVDDDTATVTASIADTNGDMTVMPALVERSGAVWVKNLPLNSGTNTVTLTATNAAGNVSTTNFNVVQSAVSLSIDPLPASELNQSSVTVTGTVGNFGDNVTVNGIAANVTGNTWEADDVPVNPSGTASLDVEVTDTSGNAVASQISNQLQPVTVGLMSYSGSQQGIWNGTINWLYSQGGNYHYYQFADDEGNPAESYFYPIPPDGNGFSIPSIPTLGSGSLTPPWENATVAVSSILGYNSFFQYNIQSQVMIEPQGQAVPGQTALYLVMAAASETSDPTRVDAGYGPTDFGFLLGDPSWWYGNVPLPPEWLQINGQTLVDSGVTNDDGSVSGMTLVQGAAGATVPLTMTATQLYGYNDYTFPNVQAQPVQLHILANGYDLSVTNPEFCVGQAVTNQLVFCPPLPTNTPVSYQWSASLDFVNSASPPVNPDGSTYPDIDPTLLTNNPTLMWWYDGGNKYVFCKATVTLPNGQTATVTAEGNVSIFQPQVEFTDGSPAYPMLYDGFMELGDENLQQGNMTFAAEVISTNSFPGTANWTQLNNRTASYPNEDQDTDGEFWLDTSQFYNNSSNFPPTDIAPFKGTVKFQDAPGVSDVYGFETITDSFKTYLVFQPASQNGSSNIWVTLGIVTWGWSATESAFTLTATNVTQATYSDSDQFPTWLHTGTGRHN